MARSRMAGDRLAQETGNGGETMTIATTSNRDGGAATDSSYTPSPALRGGNGGGYGGGRDPRMEQLTPAQKERLRSATPAQRQQARSRWESASPAERQDARQRYESRQGGMGGSGGGQGGQNGGGGRGGSWSDPNNYVFQDGYYEDDGIFSGGGDVQVKNPDVFVEYEFQENPRTGGVSYTGSTDDRGGYTGSYSTDSGELNVRKRGGGNVYSGPIREY
jgi:hypothetical protein